MLESLSNISGWEAGYTHVQEYGCLFIKPNVPWIFKTTDNMWFMHKSKEYIDSHPKFYPDPIMVPVD